MIDQSALNTHFREVWNNIEGVPGKVSPRVVDVVTALNSSPNLVIDVGCGHNQYKGVIPNLVGFDPVEYNSNIDQICTLEDAKFDTESADIIMALGSINYGSFDYILSQYQKLDTWLKPGGYVVCRANVTPTNQIPHHRRNSQYYSMNENAIANIATAMNYDILNVNQLVNYKQYDMSTFGPNRKLWVYKK